MVKGPDVKNELHLSTMRWFDWIRVGWVSQGVYLSAKGSEPVEKFTVQTWRLSTCNKMGSAATPTSAYGHCCEMQISTTTFLIDYQGVFVQHLFLDLLNMLSLGDLSFFVNDWHHGRTLLYIVESNTLCFTRRLRSLQCLQETAPRLLPLYYLR